MPGRAATAPALGPADDDAKDDSLPDDPPLAATDEDDGSALPDSMRLFEAAGRPRAVSCAARRALRGSLAAVVALMLLAAGAELVFPSRGAQFRSLDEL